MAIYKIKYRKECECIMRVEANSKEEAISKYENFDCIDGHEVQGLRESIVAIKKE